MPVVKINLWEGRSDETKAKMIKDITRVVADNLGLEEKHVWVILDEQPRKDWGIGGKLGTELK